MPGSAIGVKPPRRTVGAGTKPACVRVCAFQLRSSGPAPGRNGAAERRSARLRGGMLPSLADDAERPPHMCACLEEVGSLRGPRSRFHVRRCSLSRGREGGSRPMGRGVTVARSPPQHRSDSLGTGFSGGIRHASSCLSRLEHGQEGMPFSAPERGEDRVNEESASPVLSS